MSAGVSWSHTTPHLTSNKSSKFPFSCLRSLAAVPLLQTSSSRVLHLSGCSCLSRIRVASALWILSLDGCKKSLIFSLSGFIRLFIVKYRGTALKPVTCWSWNWKYPGLIFRSTKTPIFFLGNSWFMQALSLRTVTGVQLTDTRLLLVMPWHPHPGRGGRCGKDLRPFVFQIKHRALYNFLMVLGVHRVKILSQLL